MPLLLLLYLAARREKGHTCHSWTGTQGLCLRSHGHNRPVCCLLHRGLLCPTDTITIQGSGSPRRARWTAGGVLPATGANTTHRVSSGVKVRPAVRSLREMSRTWRDFVSNRGGTVDRDRLVSARDSCHLRLPWIHCSPSANGSSQGSGSSVTITSVLIWFCTSEAQLITETVGAQRSLLNCLGTPVGATANFCPGALVGPSGLVLHFVAWIPDLFLCWLLVSIIWLNRIRLH